MLRVVEKPVYANWVKIPLLEIVHIIHCEYTRFNSDLLRIEVDPIHADKFKCGRLLKTEYLDGGKFRYTVELHDKKGLFVFDMNEYFFELVVL